MVEAGYGRIVNVASVTGPLVSFEGTSAYSAAKAGMVGLTQTLALEGQERHHCQCRRPRLDRNGLVERNGAAGCSAHATGAGRATGRGCRSGGVPGIRRRQLRQRRPCWWSTAATAFRSARAELLETTGRSRSGRRLWKALETANAFAEAGPTVHQRIPQLRWRSLAHTSRPFRTWYSPRDTKAVDDYANQFMSITALVNCAGGNLRGRIHGPGF